MNAKVLLWDVVRNECHRAVREDSFFLFLYIACSSPKRFGRDARFIINKFLGALAANLGSRSSDAGLSSIAVCSLHGYYGNSLHTVALLIVGFSSGLFCGAGLVSLRDGSRSGRPSRGRIRLCRTSAK